MLLFTANSNTTFVKVKYGLTEYPQFPGQIQIQHLLKLNIKLIMTAEQMKEFKYNIC